MSAGHVGDTRSSGIASSAADVLWMSGIGGVCEMCMCLARDGEWGELMRGLSFTSPVGRGGVLDLGCGGVGGSIYGASTRVWRVVLCLC